ncbi:High-affnity carbon uptake protein Hat/HatR [Enhygromyxa salina]|uniref:High-affnity carbon uptake protein Hat/HatR n=1 Tax=Enhygromyxa salina TaxID=215803 RepID=A0A0C2CMR5_9BACT|nr:High-affnity carbon uptake protein Hat/HatR [Enhygromyxa salina]
MPIELLEARDRGELIICVGPGLGRSAGLPSMAELATKLLADAEATGRELDFVALREWIAAGRISESLEILQRRLGARFERVVERALADRGRPVPDLARAIAALGDQLRAVHTTGIDRMVERAFEDQWPSFASPRSDMARRTKLIVKLCGALEFPETWVLTRAALDAEFGERSLRRRLLVCAYQAHCLLFVGFDPAEELAERLFSSIDLGGDAQLPSHFVVVERCGIEQRALLERRGLHVIVGEPVAVLEALDASGQARELAPSQRLPDCPYPGLASFDDALAGVFHGRRAEVSQAAARLGGPASRHRRWLAIEGSSGVGKSSFVHAGLIPALCRGFAEGTPTRWQIAKLRPGRAPCRALAQALVSASARAEVQDTERARVDELDSPARVAEFVRAKTEAGVGVLVVVDQLEEIVTLASPDEGARFSACLTALLEQQLIYLVTTLRADFTALLASSLPPFARLLNERGERHALAPISRVGLRAAISEPAAQLGVSFEGDLVERIASDAEQHLRSARPNADVIVRTDDAALPLVAHVMRGLWDTHALSRGMITFANYEALGGVSGALSRSADALLTALDAKQRACVKTLLLAMVKLDGGRLVGRTLPRAEALELAGGGAKGELLLGVLCGSAGPRLLVARREGQAALVDLVHEALLREWDCLRGWIAAHQAQLARDEALARRSEDWIAQGRPRRSLPRGPERQSLRQARPHGRDASNQREFQRAMTRAAWLRAAGWAAVAAVLVIVGVIVDHEIRRQAALTQQREAELHTTRSTLATTEEQLGNRELDTQRKRRRDELAQLLADGRCKEALLGTLDAQTDDSPQMRELLRRATSCEVVLGVVGRTPPTGHGVTALGVSPDRREVWAGRADGSVDRWDLEAHQHHMLEGLTDSVRHIVFAPNGKLVALSGANGRTTLTDSVGSPTGVSLQGLEPSFSTSSRQLALRQTKKRVSAHDAVSGEQLWAAQTQHRATGITAGDDTLAHATSTQSGSEVVIRAMRSDAVLDRVAVPSYLRDFAISPDGRYVATTADDNFTRTWDLTTGEEATAVKLNFPNDGKALKFVTYAPDGSMLATLQSKNSVLIGDSTLHPLCTIDEVDPAAPTMFAPDSRWFVVIGLDHDLQLWDPGTCERVARVGLNGKLSALSFTPRSDEIVAGFEDGSLVHLALDARDWWKDPAPHYQGVKALRFSPVDPRQLASGSSAGSAHVWSIGSTDDLPRKLQHHGWVSALGFSADGTQILAYSDQGALLRWALGANAEPSAAATPAGCASRSAAITPSSTLLALLCPGDGAFVVWDITQQRAVLEGPTGMRARTLELSNDGTQLAIGGDDGALGLWQFPASGGASSPLRLADHHQHVTSLAFDASGSKLVSGGSDATVVVWTLDDLERPQVLASDAMVGREIESVAIASSGALIAAGDKHDGVIALWDASGRALDHAATGCNGHAVSTLRFSPDDQLLAAGCSDGSVRTWPIAVAAQIEFACARLARTRGDEPVSQACLPTQD